MNLFKKKIRVATHNGSFHADEVFAIATLLIWANKKGFKLDITRTRDESVLDKADIVLDVGGIYDPEKKRFDHHQKEGAGTHENGPTSQGLRGASIPYASFGLIWKHYAEEICSREVAEDIEKRLVLPIDGRDNGMNITKALREDLLEYTLSRDIISAFRPTWKNPNDNDKNFFEAVSFA